MNIPPHSLHRKYTRLSQEDDDEPKHGYPVTSRPGELYELGESSNTHARVINFSNNHQHTPSPIDYILYTIQSGDTLHNLSVRYSCPVASIKRLNNLWTDQEFYGLTRIKLPVGKLRLLADLIGGDDIRQQQQQQQQQVTYSNSTLTNHHDPHHHAQKPPELLQDSSTSMVKTSDSLFKDLDSNIEQARTAALNYDENASAIMQTLAQGGNIVGDNENESSDSLNDPHRIARREAEMLLNDMCDTDLSYSCLLLFIFIVCFICPIAYVIYLEETSESRGQVPLHHTPMHDQQDQDNNKLPSYH